MPIPLGVLAVAGFRPSAAGAFELIQSTLLTSATASVTFSNLGNFSTTYEHLQVRASMARTSGGLTGIGLRLNGDSGGNYANHLLFGNGSSVQSSAGTGETSIGIGLTAASSTVFGASVVDILDAYNASKNTTVRTLTGINPAGDTPFVQLRSGLWLNTASITSISFSGVSDFVAGTRFSLYGIKAVA